MGYGASNRTYFNREPSYQKPLNDVARARTLIHEAIHANFNNETETGGTIRMDQHKYMASPEFREDIKKGLKEYVNWRNINNISDEEIDILSWGGLTETEQFKNKYDTSKKRKQFFERLEAIETKTLQYEKKE